MKATVGDFKVEASDGQVGVSECKWAGEDQ